MSSKRDGIYRRKDRSGLWISWNDSQGKRRYRRTDAENLVQAQKIRSAELVRVEQARVIGFTPPGDENFSEMAARYLAHQKARLAHKSYERERCIVDLHLKPFFTGRLATIRRVDIQRYITKRSGQTSAHSLHKEFVCIKHMLRLAVEWELIPVNPAYGIKAPKVPAGRVRYLQPTELKTVIEKSPEWLRPIVALLVSTGMRRGEVVGLRFLDVDLSHNRILLPQTKNGDGRIVYLNQSARAVLSSLTVNEQTRTTDKVFPGITGGKVTIAFRRACKESEIQDFRLHDLRHTAASWLRMAGADIHTVAQLLGHKDLRMAARYQHLSPGYLAEAVGRLDTVFGNLCYQDVTNEKALTDGTPVSA